jgi:hypothetical protein
LLAVVATLPKSQDVWVRAPQSGKEQAPLNELRSTGRADRDPKRAAKKERLARQLLAPLDSLRCELIGPEQHASYGAYNGRATLNNGEQRRATASNGVTQ